QLPIRWTPQPRWNLAVRPEVAWDSHGRWTLAEQTVKALTSTVEYRVPYNWANTLVRVEHRVDNSRGPQGGFFDDHDVRPGVAALTPTQHLLIVGLIFTFDAPSRR
ncbi:MAG TPA: outer membrane beta-barrel protein, partial [Vicinamibacterales bacterium]|nr:outer membrane beta-barrel protein [Vicinamibacterales bacterium]